MAVDRLISLILSPLLGKIKIILPTQQCVWGGESFYLHNSVCVWESFYLHNDACGGSTLAILTRSSTCLSIALQRKTVMSSSKDCSTLYGTCLMPAPPSRASPIWKENVLEIAWTQTKYLAFVIYLETVLGHSFIKGALVKMEK